MNVQKNYKKKKPSGFLQSSRGMHISKFKYTFQPCAGKGGIF